jgi:hypothetical protein
VEKLCLALRDIGVFNRELPDGQSPREAIARAKNLHAEIRKRGLNVSYRISRLSDETNWDMTSLLRDTLAFPHAVPYLASTPDPRCGGCGERISRKATLSLCPQCITSGIAEVSVEQSNPQLETCSICGQARKGFFVSADGWIWWQIYCKSCLEEEQARQNAA